MDDAFDGRVAVVPDRIGDFGRRCVELRFVRDELARDRVVGAAGIDQLADVRCDRDGVARGNRVQVCDPLRLDQVRVRQLFGGSQHAFIHRSSTHSWIGVHITRSIRPAWVASITSRSNPNATPLAGGMCASAARKSSSIG